MNALYRIASKLEAIDPLLSYEFSDHLKSLVATDRRFVLELNSRTKNLSSPRDKIELVENRSGGWDWIHTNVDGAGTRDKTGWRLQPTEVLKMIDQSIEPGPMTDEIKIMLEQEVSAGNPGVPRGSEMSPALPTDLSGLKMTEEKGGISEGNPSYHSVWDIGSQRLIKKAVHTAYSHPDLRPIIIPILSKLVNHSR